MLKTLHEKSLKIALLKSYIKEDVSSQEETKRYLFGLRETQFVERHVSIPVKHSKIGAKNLNKVCRKSVQNALKWPLQYVNFQKNFGEACPRTLWSLFFLFLKLLQINSAGQNQIT